MLDRYNRRIHYLRISVTDLCNMRCVYCMPPEGVKLLSHEDILSFEEIEKVVRIAVSLGIDKVRLTGGEPLVRRDILKLVQMLAAIDGISDFAMTTNGTLLAAVAADLRKAGIMRLNISLDTLDPDRYRVPDPWRRCLGSPDRNTGGQDRRFQPDQTELRCTAITK